LWSPIAALLVATTEVALAVLPAKPVHDGPQALVDFVGGAVGSNAEGAE